MQFNESCRVRPVSGVEYASLLKDLARFAHCFGFAIPRELRPTHPVYKIVDLFGSFEIERCGPTRDWHRRAVVRIFRYEASRPAISLLTEVTSSLFEWNSDLDRPEDLFFERADRSLLLQTDTVHKWGRLTMIRKQELVLKAYCEAPER